MKNNDTLIQQKTIQDKAYLQATDLLLYKKADPEIKRKALNILFAVRLLDSSKTIYYKDPNEYKKEIQALNKIGISGLYLNNEYSTEIIPVEYSKKDLKRILSGNDIDTFRYISETGYKYGNTAYIGLLNTLIIDVYVLDLLQTIKTNDPAERLLQLRELQFTEHKDLFNKAYFKHLQDQFTPEQKEYYTLYTSLLDLAHKDEYINEIDKQLQSEIDKIINTAPKPLDETINKILQDKNKFEWNADKTALGTIIGTLIDEGIIKAKKQTAIDVFTAIFKDIRKSTFANNIYQKTNTNETKTYYHIEAQSKTKELIKVITKPKHRSAR